MFGVAVLVHLAMRQHLELCYRRLVVVLAVDKTTVLPLTVAMAVEVLMA